MKRHFPPLRKTSLLLLMVALLVLPMTYHTRAAAADPTIPYVYDEANLLTPDQVDDLTAEIDHLRKQFQVNFVIVTVNTLNGTSPAAYANTFYDDFLRHQSLEDYEETSDGILMLLAMESRDYYFLLSGAVREKITDGYGLSLMKEKVVPYLSGQDYHEAFHAYLDTAASLLAAPATEDGKVVSSGRTDEFPSCSPPMEMEKTVEERWQCVAIFAVIGVVAGFVTTFLMTRGMKTARAQKFAMDYVRPGSFHLTRKQDMFLYRTRTRVRVQSDSSSHGGSRSGGSSRSGGGGKF